MIKWNYGRTKVKDSFSALAYIVKSHLRTKMKISKSLLFLNICQSATQHANDIATYYYRK